MKNIKYVFPELQFMRKLLTKSIVLLTAILLTIVSIGNSQSVGSVYVNLKLKSVYSDPGMEDYENYDRTPGWQKPDLYFHVEKANINSATGGAQGSQSHLFYENEHSHVVHYPNTTLVNSPININTFNGYFDLSNYDALNFDFHLWGNEEDRPWNQALAGDDDYGYGLIWDVNFNWMASTGEVPKTRKFSISGTTGSGTTIPYGYYFNFESYYVIDALETHLTYLNPSDRSVQSQFCMGDWMIIRANYKWPFGNGVFQWQRKIGNGNWTTIGNYKGQEIYDVARVEPTIYRARLIADTGHYGVSDFDGYCVAVSNPITPLIVNEQIGDFDYNLVDACTVGGQGDIRITSIGNAQDGSNYIVVLEEDDGGDNIEIDFVNITGYYNGYLSDHDVSFAQFPGNYSIQIKNAAPGLACFSRKYFSIQQSTIPEFDFVSADPKCSGEDGKITFNNIVSGSPLQPIGYTLIAESIVNNTIFEKNITERSGFLDVPVGEYKLKVVNSGGCAYEHPTNVIIYSRPILSADLIMPPTTLINGTNYHGICSESNSAIKIAFAGGAPPYIVHVEVPGFGTNNDHYIQVPLGKDTLTIPGFRKGNYVMNVWDKFGCVITPVPFSINNPSPITFDNFSAVNPTAACGGAIGGGSISSNVAGGIPPYTLYYNGSEVTAFDTSGLGNTVANLLIVDSQGCQASKTTTLMNAAFLTITDGGQLANNLINCDGTSDLFIHVDGGTLYSISDFIFKKNGIDCAIDPDCEHINTYLSSYDYGIYRYGANYKITVRDDSHLSLTVTDENCTEQANYKFEYPESPVISDYSAVPPVCAGGDYIVTFLLDKINESATGPMGIINYDIDGVLGSIALDTGANGMLYESPRITLPLSSPGIHQLNITDGMGCQNDVQFEFDLEAVDTLKLNVSNIEPTSCNNDSTGTISFDLNPGAPYEVILFFNDYAQDLTINVDTATLLGNEHTFGNLWAGDYFMQATNNRGCLILSNYITIGIPNPLQATANTTSQINCTGRNGVIELSSISGGTPPYQYSLNDHAFQSSPTLLNAGLENTIVIKDSHSCFEVINLSIPPVGQTLFSTISELDQVTDCSTGSAVIAIDPGFNYPILIKNISDPLNYDSPGLVITKDSLIATTQFDTITNLEVGTHYFLIRDGFGCELIDSVSITAGPNLASAVLSKTVESCYQQSSDGTLSIQTSGGNAPYAVSLNGAAPIMTNDIATFNNLPYGGYLINIQDASGCFFNLEDSIFAGSLPLTNYSIDNYAGCSGIDLMADVTLVGYNGTAPYTYLWEDGNTANPHIATARQEYHVTVTDANGCTNQETVHVTQIDSLVLDLSSKIDVTCQADADGIINVNAVGGFPPYEFSSDGGMTYQSDSSFFGFGIGQHEILVKDNHDCLGNITVSIDNTNPLAASVSSTDNNCASANDGTLTINATSGVSPFVYSIDGSNFQAQNIFTNLAPGIYQAWVEDGSGCQATYTNIIIDGPTLLSLSTDQVVDASCGQTDGSATITASGGTPPYIYEWNNDPLLDQPTLSNVAAGLHTLKITDTNGCVESEMVSIANIAGPVLTIENTIAEICGNANGTIDLNINSGIAPYTLSWSHDNNLTDSLATNLPAGNYMITVEDANGCADFIQIDIDEIQGPALSILSQNNSLCSNNNGSIEVGVSNGTAPFDYDWSHDNALNDNMAENLPGGNYEVTITDDNNCTDIVNITLEFEAPPSIGVANIVNESCSGINGSITVPVTGANTPFTYSWSHDALLDSNTATTIAGGNYSLTVTNAIGCTTELLNINVVNSFPPSLSVASFVNADCLNPQGSITVSANGGLPPYEYFWSHDNSENEATVEGLGSGTYIATVVDANGCSDIVSQSLISFVGSSEITGTLNCFGESTGAIEVTLEGNLNDYTFQWSDASIPAGPSATGLTSGTYFLSVTNSNGCEEVFTEEIVEPAELIVNIDDIIPVGCNGNLGSAMANVIGGIGDYNYQWNTPNADITAAVNNLPIGNYEVTITDENGCLVTDFLSITQSAPIELNEGEIIESDCAGEEAGSIEVIATEGFMPYDYLWDNNQTTPIADNLSGGNHSVTVTDAVGCTEVITIELIEPQQILAEAIIDQDINCFGDENGSISLTTSGGTGTLMYQWNDSAMQTTANIEELPSGNYSVIINDANGCEIEENVSLASPAAIVIASAEVIPGQCSDVPNAAIQITANGGTQDLSYNWSSGANTANINELLSGVYDLTISDVNNCSLTASYEVISPIVESIELGQSDTTLCNGDFLIFDYSNEPFNDFNWGSLEEGQLSDGNVFSISEPGTYFYSAFNSDGCEINDTINVNYAATSLDAFFIAPTDIVVGDTLVAVELSLPIPDDVSWSYESDDITFLGQNENQFFFSFNNVGTFELGLTSQLGNCYSEISKTIFVYADSSQIPFVNPLVPAILDLRLFPNPSNGIFTLEVDLSKNEDMVIDIFNTQSTLIDRAQFSGNKNYAKDYNLTLTTGIYYAIVRVAKERRTLTLVVD